MVYRAFSKHGIVILPPGLRLPDGPVEVRTIAPVEPPSEPANGVRPLNSERRSVFELSPVSVGALLQPLPADDDLLRK